MSAQQPVPNLDTTGEIKPGIYTSEFWLTVVAQLISVLTVFGVLKGDDGKSLGDALTQAVLAIFSLAGSAHVVAHYIRSRGLLKMALLLACFAPGSAFAQNC
jgi:hypothetical protein